MLFKTLIGGLEEKAHKIELELLQIILESDTEWCANKDVGPPMEWIVRSHVSWNGE